MSRFGTHGESLLLDAYRELYWYANELQLCGATDTDEYRRVEEKLRKIEKTLGYTPEP
jgi:hypothetical protein